MAALLYAVGMNLFVVPSNIYVGGLYGICQVLRTVVVQGFHYQFGFDIASIIYYVINIPIFIIALIKISRRFLIKSAASLTAMTVFLAVIPIRGVLPDDRLASCLIGGIICGAAGGIILRCGSSAGGFDIIGLLLTMRNPNMSVGKVSLAVNVLLYTACLFLFDIKVVIYSLIFSAIYSFTMDKVHTQNIVVEAKIITKSHEQIEQAIMSTLQRGTTKWTCTGGYTGEEGRIIYVLLSKYELPQLRLLLRQYDPHAFLILSEDVRVQGNFLKRIDS